MLIGSKRYQWLEADNGANPSLPAPVVSAETKVEGAISDVTKAVAEAPNKAMEDLLSSVKDVLGGVTEQLKRANDLAEKAAQPEPEPEPEPTTPTEPEVILPKPQERKVRRGGRKVVKRAK